MFTKWQQVEDWVRDNGLTWWRFTLDEAGVQATADGQQEQRRSNKVITLSDALPGDIDEKLALTRKRLLTETSHTLYGQGKRGKENTGLMYCEVRLVDEFQQPSTQAVSSVPSYTPAYDEEKLSARIRKECMLEFENLQYQKEKKDFELAKQAFEAEKASAIGALVHFFAPVASALTSKGVAGVDAAKPLIAAPVQPVQQTSEELQDELFTDEESDKLFELMARFKAVEPRYLELIENVVRMAENGDQTYVMAKQFLLK